MVEAGAHLQVGVSEYAETVQGLVTVNGIGANLRIAVVAKDGRLAAIVALVVIANGNDRNGKARFKGETLRHRGTYVPVAVENVAQVVDDGLDVSRTLSVLAIESRHGFEFGGPAVCIHGENGTSP